MRTATEILTEAGIRPSLQRLAVVEWLAAHRTHPTADEIYSALADSIPTLSKTTVYNTLHLLADKGAILMLTIDSETARFDADTSLHAHFQCTCCGRVYDIPAQQFPGGMPERICGHRINECHQYYRGICSECEKKNRINN